MTTIGPRVERQEYPSVEAYLLDLAKDIAPLVKKPQVMDRFRKQIRVYAQMWERWETVQKADQENRWNPSMGKPENPLDSFDPAYNNPYDPEKESRQLPGFYSLLAFIHDKELPHLPQINNGIVTDQEVIRQTLSAPRRTLDDTFIDPRIPSGPDVREIYLIEQCFNCVKIDLKEHFRREGKTEREAAASLVTQIKGLSAAELFEHLAALFEKRAERLFREDETWRDLDRSLKPWFNEVVSLLEGVKLKEQVGLLQYWYDNLIEFARRMQISRFRGHYTNANIVSSAHGYATELAKAFGDLAQRTRETGGTNNEKMAKPMEKTKNEEDLTQVGDDSALSPAELAKRFGVPYAALRKRLERLRSQDHDCFIEVSNRKPKEAQYLYKVGHVRKTIEGMIKNVQRNVQQTSSDEKS